MKLIVSELGALERYVSREFHYVMTDLITNHDWRQVDTGKLWSGRRTMKEELLDAFGELPEVILFWEGYDFLAARAGNVRQLDCKKYIFADDLHWWNEQMKLRRFVSFALCNMILSAYGYVWDNFYPQLSDFRKVAWVPHSASPDFMLPFNHQPENSILLSGAVSEHYPLRQRMKLLHANHEYSIAYIPHPGYHCQYDYDNDENVGRGYAEKINRHRAGFTDSGKFKYVVAKYFEIPATGALLLADRAVSGPLKRLGLIENQHYLSVSDGNLEERIRYVLDERNHQELDEIRRRGRELIRERHKTSDRARQINEMCVA